MGYSSNLKKQRKPIVDAIENELKRINENEMEDKELFNSCDNILKVVNLKFNMERKDSKLYNKYNKLILNEVLPKKIFNLSYMNPKDYSMDLAKIKKNKIKDPKFIYLFTLKSYMNITNTYNILKQNIMDNWIEEDKNKKKILFKKDSEYIKQLEKNNKDARKRLDEHVRNVIKVIEENNYTIYNKEYYTELIEIIKLTLEKVNSLPEENQINFYTFHLESLLNDLVEINKLNIYNYINEIFNIIGEYLQKDLEYILEKWYKQTVKE